MKVHAESDIWQLKNQVVRANMMVTLFLNDHSLTWHCTQTDTDVSTLIYLSAGLYMEEVESRALITCTWTAPSHRFRYVGYTWVKIRGREVEAVAEHINAVESNIKFTWEDVRGDSLPFMDCAVHTEEDSSLNFEVFSSTWIYIFFFQPFNHGGSTQISNDRTFHNAEPTLFWTCYLFYTFPSTQLDNA